MNSSSVLELSAGSELTFPRTGMLRHAQTSHTIEYTHRYTRTDIVTDTGNTVAVLS